MAFEKLLKSNPIAREVTYKGETETMYFRPLTAGERLQLKQGQRGKVGAGGEVAFDVDLGDVDRRNHQLLHFTTCHEDGKPYFKTLKDVQDKPADFIDAVLAACGDALKEDDSGN